MAFKKPKGEPEKWITVNGNHIPVYKGQSNMDAIYWHSINGNKPEPESKNKTLKKDEDTKEKQIKKSKEEADRLNNEEKIRSQKTNTGLSKKSQLSEADIKEYEKYSEYSGELANAVNYTDTPVYQIKHNGGKAFADVTQSGNSYHIEMMGSTGKGAGTEILRQIAQKALDNKSALQWDADVQSAIKYYSHIGADKYSKQTRYGKTYSINPEQLQSFINSLQKRGK